MHSLLREGEPNNMRCKKSKKHGQLLPGGTCPAAWSPEVNVTSLETFKAEVDIEKSRPCYTRC